MKKVIITLLILIFVAFCFGRYIAGKNSEKTNELVFWTLQLGTFSDYIQPIIDEFEQNHPEIKVVWVDVPYSEGGKRTLASIMSDNPPDLINSTPDFATLLAQKNTLYTFDKSQVEQYLPSVTESLTLDGGQSFYAIPFYATTAVTIYNKDLAKKAGINEPPKTYEELYGYAKPVVDNSEPYIIMPTINENDTFLKILNKYDLASDKKINSRESAELVNSYKSYYENNLIPKESLTQTHREALEKYMSRKIIFYNGGANFLNLIKENAPDVYEVTDISPQLVGKNGKYDFSLMNLIIPKNAKNKELALEFAKLLTNEKNQLEFAKLTTVMPVNKDTLQNEYFTNSVKNLQDKARVLSAKQLRNTLKPIIYKDQKGLTNMTNKIIAEILLNKIDTKKGLDELSSWWKEHK